MKNHTKKTDRFQAEFHETLLWYSLLIPLGTLLTVAAGFEHPRTEYMYGRVFRKGHFSRKYVRVTRHAVL